MLTAVFIDKGREAHFPFAQNHGMKPWDRVQFWKPGCPACGPHYVSPLASWRMDWEAWIKRQGLSVFFKSLKKNWRIANFQCYASFRCIAKWFSCIYLYLRGFPGGSAIKNPPANAGDAGNAGLIPWSGRSLEKEMATHSSGLGWEIPWTEEPGGLLSMGLRRAGHSWAAKNKTKSVSIHSFFQNLFHYRLLQDRDYGDYYKTCAIQ